MVTATGSRLVAGGRLRGLTTSMILVRYCFVEYRLQLFWPKQQYMTSSIVCFLKKRNGLK